MADWPGEADSVYLWGGALAPKILDTAAVGPGYDHSAVPGRTPLVRNREEGKFYSYAWDCCCDVIPRPDRGSSMSRRGTNSTKEPKSAKPKNTAGNTSN